MVRTNATMRYSLLIVALMALCLSHSNVSGIMCFQCNSNNRSDCSDLANYNQSPWAIVPEDCKQESYGKPFCRKTILRVMDKNKQLQERIIRSCGYIPSKRDCYKTDNEGHQETVCQCFQDSCNSSNIIKASVLVLLPFVLLIKACFTK